MATKKANTGMIQTAQIEEIVTKIVDSRLKETMEEFARTNGSRVKEMALLERIVRVEEELKSLREMFGIRFEAIDGRFDSLLREMNARFEAMDKRFSMLQWLIGILVGIPSITFTIIQLVKVL